MNGWLLRVAMIVVQSGNDPKLGVKNMRPQKLLAILVLIASLFNLGLPGAAATQQNEQQGSSVFVAREGDVRKVSAPSLGSRREQTHLTATIGGPVIESGGGPEVKYTVSSNQGHVELKAGGLTDLGGTYVPTTFRSDKEVDDSGGTHIAYTMTAGQGGTGEPPIRVEKQYEGPMYG